MQQLNLNIIETCEAGTHILVGIPETNIQVMVNSYELEGEPTEQEIRTLAIAYLKLLRGAVPLEEVKDILSEEESTELLTTQ